MTREIQVKSVLRKYKKRDDWFLIDYSANPYPYCPFGCVYCYVHGSKYGQHMHDQPTVKINAAEVFEKQLARRAKKEEYGFIGLASMEPYQPIEKNYRMTRRLLEICLKYKFPVSLLTKSPMVVDDIDILKKINKAAILPQDLRNKLNYGVVVSFSFSTVSDDLARIWEPGAPLPSKRLDALAKCSKAGLKTGAFFMPVLPYITDSEEELDKMFKTVKECGADCVLVGGLTLYGDGPKDCKITYYQMLQKHYPELVEKTKELFKGNWAPSWKYQGDLNKMARRLCKKHDLKYGLS
ncbi:radical SAM protein [Candidatus Margulisiibacteriota bacterium]